MDFFENEIPQEEFQNQAKFHAYERKYVKPVDPYNPFDNPTENPEYNRDYGEVVPQIAVPGCELPFIPGKEEKKKIRNSYNIAGGGILLHIASSVVIANILYVIAMMIIIGINGISISDAFRDRADDISAIIDNTSIFPGITLISYLAANLLAFFIGCRFAGTKPSSLFRTKNLKVSDIICYAVIGLFVQRVAAIALTALMQLLPNADLIGNSQVISYSGAKALIISTCYTCIIAPVTEELLYRGFIMNTFSRVSQRFAILISAFFFGISHGNAAQFVLAFLLGIFMGYIDIKHNSVLPSIFVHFFVNCFAGLSGIVTTYAGEGSVLLGLFGFVSVILFIAGLVLFILFARKNTMPKMTIHQQFRCGKIALTSPTTIISGIIYIILFAVTTFSS